jgi:hypothetical protein
MDLVAYIREAEFDDWFVAEEEEYDKELIAVNSFERGYLLYEIIKCCDCEEYKYYLFNKWWSSMDSGQNLFHAKLVKSWLSSAFVKLDLSDLDFDDNGYLTVYRGENIRSLPHEYGALSWTTSRIIAENFARGARLRTTAVSNPAVLIGKVHKNDIIGRFDGREECEILCSDVIVYEKIKLE